MILYKYKPKLQKNIDWVSKKTYRKLYWFSSHPEASVVNIIYTHTFTIDDVSTTKASLIVLKRTLSFKWISDRDIGCFLYKYFSILMKINMFKYNYINTSKEFHKQIIYKLWMNLLLNRINRMYAIKDAAVTFLSFEGPIIQI